MEIKVFLSLQMAVNVYTTLKTEANVSKMEGNVSKMEVKVSSSLEMFTKVPCSQQMLVQSSLKMFVKVSRSL